MSVRRWLGAAALCGAVLVLTSPAHSQRKRDAELPLTKRLARDAKVTEEQATRLFNALGPALRDELKNGKVASIPGLGSFRVVRIEEHKDIERGTGRVLRIPARNTVEFVPEGVLEGAANSATAKPQDTVPAFEYVPLPDRANGQKTGTTRSTGTRTK